jgi:hypothetical protein
VQVAQAVVAQAQLVVTTELLAQQTQAAVQAEFT